MRAVIHLVKGGGTYTASVAFFEPCPFWADEAAAESYTISEFSGVRLVMDILLRRLSYLRKQF
jgi:hypothetical protein